MEIKIIKKSVTRSELREMARQGFGDMVKAVVDTKQGIMAIGGELHADEEVVLVEEEGAEREYAWGINLYPDPPEGGEGEGFIEFNSMINIKPHLGNRSRGVEDADIRKKIQEVVKKLLKEE
ncbi:MAG: DUF5674 family protein [Nanoarchaeota archaeon]|nr:DUF5674 family protein [Nanoarchaeota archaeon]